MAFSFIINGKAKEINFTSLSITQRVDALADDFEMAVATPLNNPPAITQYNLRVSDLIQIYWAGALLLTGHVEQQNISLDGQTRTVSYAGRSKAGDLVDSTFTKSYEWAKGSALSDIIHDMLKTFDIAFHPDNNQSLHSTKDITAEAGNSLYESLRSFGSAFGIFFSSRPDGDITAFKPINDAGANRLSAVQSPRTPREPLPIFTARLGYNILSLHMQNDETIKFSPIIVVPTDSLFGNSKQAIAKDATVKRHRPLYLQAQADGITPATRANFKVRSNLRKAQQISLTIPEILPLPPASIIHIDADEVGIKGDYAISAQTMIADDRGNRTEFECVMPEALIDIHEPL